MGDDMKGLLSIAGRRRVEGYLRSEDRVAFGDGRRWRSCSNDNVDAGSVEGVAERLGGLLVGDEHVDEVEGA
jgi:hypothetical protein